MTITLQAVNELIAFLESAGELSIREQKYLDVMRWAIRVAGERDAALNAELVWEKTMMEACGEDGPASVANEIRSLRALRDTAIQALKSQVEQLSAENAGLKAAFDKPQAYLSWHAIPPTWEDPLPCGEYLDVHDDAGHKNSDGTDCWPVYAKPEINTPATDAFLAEVKTEARKEGAYFVANRMLAAWEAGFIDDTAKNAADIARMILTSTEFMANAPEGDFDRSFSDGVLEDIAAQLRKGGNQ